MFITLYFCCGLVVFFVLLARFQKLQTLRKRQAAIREKWGKPTDVDRNFDLISLYIGADENETYIPYTTSADIDLENTFSFIDRTNSKPGQQYLYNRLLSTRITANELAEFDTQLEALATDRALQESIELELSKLGGTNAYYIPEVFKKEQQALFTPLLTFYIKSAAIIMIALAVLMILTHNQFYFLTLFAMVVANAGIHYGNKKKVYQFTYSLPQLLVLVDVAKWLTKNSGLKVDDEVLKSLNNAKKLKSSLRFVSFEGDTAKDPSDITFALFELLKMIFLLEPLMFVNSLDKVNKYRADIKQVFNYVGKIDALISVHSLRISLPYFCKPNFATKGSTLNVSGLYHPLVKDCVSNSIITQADQGVLVTGSNMSGKTTFIRAIALNTLLAQTLFTCCSENYSAPWLKIFTSIRVSDDIEEHKSYFQAEALSVLDIVNQCHTDEAVKSLVIIDEIFRGTNTIERIAAAKAVLAYLTANQNFVFVSTHDLELAELLGADYAVYSFEELVADGTRLVFDYKIKPGLLKNKNGIAILQNLGFPPSVVQDAIAVSEQLRNKYQL